MRLQYPVVEAVWVIDGEKEGVDSSDGLKMVGFDRGDARLWWKC